MHPIESVMPWHYSNVLHRTQKPEHYVYQVRYPHPAHIPLFLYPFLNSTNKTRPFEYLRLTSLGVIGALVRVLAVDLER
jgi:hypothetical protein